ncbi:MAG: hypothetical protein JXA18_08700 [Chitinispirillaceae bacterium]|nr:hypothetical protein [Chitinispirillaceae bacterium]
METRGGKILEFLRENSHLDLEVPDIAFSVKKSEKTVEAALQKYQQKGLVTARQNEYGRVYWYALPSASITKSFTIEESASPGEKKVNQAATTDDEVDVSALRGAEVPPVKKGRKTVAEPSMSINEETVLVSAQAHAAASTGRPASDAPAAAPRKEMQAAPVPEAASPEAIDFFEKSAPTEKIAAVEPEMREEPAAAASRRGFLLPAVVGFAVAALIGLIALVRSGDALSRVKKLETVSKTFSTSDAVATGLKEQAAKTGEAEKGIAVLTAQVDSLKKVVDQLVAAQKKPTVRRRYYRKR